MRLHPFTQVDDLRFTASPDEVRARWGRPVREGRNAVELDELDFGHIVCRFQASGRLEEITVRAPVLHLDKVSVPFASLAAFVRGHDPQAFERAGFLISPALGLAFVPTEPDWVTALARHCLPQWRALDAAANSGKT
ncbi:MAG: hypothetical protein QM742_09230 [Aquabacterium sp.]